MKQKKILLRCVDDSVMVMAFVLDDGCGIHREGTVSEINAEIVKASSVFPSDRLPIVGWEEIDDSDLPPDRVFRNAWVTKGGKKIDHDMTKARDIHREHMRTARARLLGDLDAEYLRADEDGDNQKKKDIAAKKKALRDVTNLPEIEAAQTPEELKAVWPDILGER